MYEGLEVWLFQLEGLGRCALLFFLQVHGLLNVLLLLPPGCIWCSYVHQPLPLLKILGTNSAYETATDIFSCHLRYCPLHITLHVMLQCLLSYWHDQLSGVVLNPAHLETKCCKFHNGIPVLSLHAKELF